MKITDLRPIKFKTHSRRVQGRWGYAYYPLEKIATKPYEVTTPLIELVTDTGANGYWWGSGSRSC